MDWESEESVVILNPRMLAHQKKEFQQILEETKYLSAHIWLCTSGTSGGTKLVGLSKEALLTSAQSVNKFLNCSKNDVWINPLPLFHVGGIGIKARCYLSGAREIPFDEKWDPIRFYEKLKESEATYTALVPTQVFDLVKNKLVAPTGMRAVIVGGGVLSKQLYEEAKKLGWKLCPSYGMTECASQIATANGESSDLQILSHVAVNINQEGFICLKSKSLLSAYATFQNGEFVIFDPKNDGIFQTEDIGEIDNRGVLRITGRKGDIVKIGGENVNFSKLEVLLSDMLSQSNNSIDMALIPFPDERLGIQVHLATIKHDPAIIEAFNAQVMPYERIRGVHIVQKIPRSALNKILKSELLESLQKF